jgi:hypothetical protein
MKSFVLETRPVNKAGGKNDAPGAHFHFWTQEKEYLVSTLTTEEHW